MRGVDIIYIYNKYSGSTNYIYIYNKYCGSTNSGEYLLYPIPVRESNSEPVDHESDALTITPLNHPVCPRGISYSLCHILLLYGKSLLCECCLSV